MMCRTQPLFRSALTVLGVVLGTLANTPCPPSPSANADVANFAGKLFDYIIIGGGTAGIALSARLSEDPTVTVGVIEAGSAHFNDPIVDAPANSPAGNATYDWLFTSVPQTSADKRVLALPRGKMLGGSSGINGLAWGRASAPEYDSLNSFAANAGWTWSGLLPYMKKSETFSLQPRNPYPGISGQQSRQASRDVAHVDGFLGPIIASYNSFYFDVVSSVVETMNAAGMPTNAEPQAGNATGTTNTLLAFDRKAGARSYSASTYYCSHAQHKNYHVLLNARATKVLFAKSPRGITATGVQFVVGGNSYKVRASREVILSAGTIQTPQLLELSGIGNSEVLQGAGIPTLVNLPGVGENMQEHLFASVQFQMKPGVETFDILRNNATFAAEQATLYATNHTGLLTETDSTLAFVPLRGIVNSSRLNTLLDMFEQEAKSVSTTPIQRLQNQHLREWFQSSDVATVEILQWSRGIVNPVTNRSYVVLLGGILHPLSRGSVHIVSNDPLAPPAIDPSFLSREFDGQVLVDIVKFMQDLGRSAPFSNLVAAQDVPDPTAQTDDDILSFIRSSAAGGDHFIGSAAMAPRSAGGVVDGSLKVYGTTNLRVVDASIIPIQIAAHTQATVYAIAEKAADIISGR